MFLYLGQLLVISVTTANGDGSLSNHLISFLIFVLSLIIILLLSKKSLTIGIFAGSVTLGFLTLSLSDLIGITVATLTNSNVILLALAVSMIPLIGEILKESGFLESMVKNFKFGEKSFLIFSPAILGLLPMPGGALFSAPMVDRGGYSIDSVRKASINVWFRHILHLIYPLAPALIIACELANLETYTLIAFLFPFFLLSGMIGFWFLLGNIQDNKLNDKIVNWSEFLKPLLIIICAPIIDFLLKFFYGLKALATFIGVSISLIIGVSLSSSKIDNWLTMVKKAKSWDFFLLIVAIYLYQAIFAVSNVGLFVESVAIPSWAFIIVISFMFGFLTGRVSTPLVILIPLYITRFTIISPLNLALMYYSTILGYIISPIHPCLVFTAEYFNINPKEIIKDLLKVESFSLALGIILYVLFHII